MESNCSAEYRKVTHQVHRRKYNRRKPHAGYNEEYIENAKEAFFKNGGVVEILDSSVGRPLDQLPVDYSEHI